MNLTPEKILCKVYGPFLKDEVLMNLFGGDDINMLLGHGNKSTPCEIINLKYSNPDEEGVVKRITNYLPGYLGNIPIIGMFVENDKIFFKGRISAVCESNSEIFGDYRDGQKWSSLPISTSERDLIISINPNFINEGFVILGEMADLKQISLQGLQGNKTLGKDGYVYLINKIIKTLELLTKSFRENPDFDKGLLATCIDSTKTSLIKDQSYPIKSLLDDLIGVDVNNEIKFFKVNRFKLAE